MNYRNFLDRVPTVFSSIKPANWEPNTIGEVLKLITGWYIRDPRKTLMVIDHKGTTHTIYHVTFYKANNSTIYIESSVNADKLTGTVKTQTLRFTSFEFI